jgi:hypothetical protein
MSQKHSYLKTSDEFWNIVAIFAESIIHSLL